jgi:hypothetical protein
MKNRKIIQQVADASHAFHLGAMLSDRIVDLRYREIARPTAYGLVIHRSLTAHQRARGFFSVSDPVTGGKVAEGLYPGWEGAIAALVQRVMSFRDQPGGFRAVFAAVRKKYMHELAQQIERGAT